MEGWRAGGKRHINQEREQKKKPVQLEIVKTEQERAEGITDEGVR